MIEGSVYVVPPVSAEQLQQLAARVQEAVKPIIDLMHGVWDTIGAAIRPAMVAIRTLWDRFATVATQFAVSLGGRARRCAAWWRGGEGGSSRRRMSSRVAQLAAYAAATGSGLLLPALGDAGARSCHKRCLPARVAVEDPASLLSA